ncbi:MAG: hypothetical protein U5K75_02985 [Ahrensia sp.]|nr:hypothetical protein [Ahrensia sp.]
MTDKSQSFIKCNHCGWHGNKTNLRQCTDSIDGELTNACPNCRTDNYLMDCDPAWNDIVSDSQTPNARSIIEELVTQIEQMRDSFDDEDGEIQASLDNAEKYLNATNE